MHEWLGRIGGSWQRFGDHQESFWSPIPLLNLEPILFYPIHHRIQSSHQYRQNNMQGLLRLKTNK